MYDCCKILNIPCIWEDKHYPRDWFIRGRLRVELKKADGTPTNPAIPDRRTLLIKIAELVPKHPNRSKKTPAGLGGGNLMDAYNPDKAAAILSGTDDAGPSKPAPALTKGGGSSKSNKKKGKK
eukprot:gene27708-7352_t